MINLDACKITKTDDLQHYIIEIVCPICKKPHEIKITTMELFKLRTSNEHIQDILPNLTDAEREMFISGVCPDCWKMLFGDPEED